jgi:hypothetical protein
MSTQFSCNFPYVIIIRFVAPFNPFRFLKFPCAGAQTKLQLGRSVACRLGQREVRRQRTEASSFNPAVTMGEASSMRARTDIKEHRYEDADWLPVAQNSARFCAFVNTEMNFAVH